MRIAVKLGNRSRAEDGVVGLSGAIVLIIVLVAVGVSAALLGRTLSAATRIESKAENIARTGTGINEATDAVVQLEQTNTTAGSILNSAQPLEGQLATVVNLANEVAGLARSINDTAGTINGTAGTINGTAVSIGNSATTINGTARGINAEAVAILDVARRINDDVAQININLDTTIAIAQQILGDADGILAQANEAHQNAACIDQKLLGAQGNDGDC